MPVPYFPHPDTANQDGFLAMGGDLSEDTLLLAYRFGIFPWYSEGQPILWWSPDPRCILWPHDLQVSKSMHQLFKRQPYQVTADQAFADVMLSCKNTKRKDQEGTWITDEMQWAYQRLHVAGVAHSIEVWQEEEMVAGLYGISLGKIFFGESMFTRVSNGSKYGFIKLVEKLRSLNFVLIDCQQDTAHLRSLGATTIPRKEFMTYLKENLLRDDCLASWQNWRF